MHPSVEVESPTRAVWAGRLWAIGVLLVLAAYFLWFGRDFIPNLAAARTKATAVVSLSHGGTEAQLQRAFAAATSGAPVDAALEPATSRAANDSYDLTVTADSAERAKTGLTTLAKALESAFPNAEGRLLVSPNDSTRPAPDRLTRSIAIALRGLIVAMILGSQLLLVVAARMEGEGRAGLLAAIATPFVLVLSGASSGWRRGGRGVAIDEIADWQFVLLLLALTPLSLLVGLWLGRGSRAARRRGRGAAR